MLPEVPWAFILMGPPHLHTFWVLITALIVLFKCFKSRQGMWNSTKFSASLFISPITSECVSERLANFYMLERYIFVKSLKEDQISLEAGLFSSIGNCAHLSINTCLLTLGMRDHFWIWTISLLYQESHFSTSFMQQLLKSSTNRCHIFEPVIVLYRGRCVYISLFLTGAITAEILSKLKPEDETFQLFLSTDLPESEKTSALTRKSSVYV